jgi:PST family polysaccharide transporter
VIAKGLSFIGQIVVAWFLMPSEMGLAAMALAISAITSVVGSGHLRTLLVQRQEAFEKEASQVYWLALVIGILISLTYVGGAPLLSEIYDEPRVIGLIYVLAAAPPLESMKVVYGASLKINLRYRTIASIHLLEAFVVNGGMIVFAVLGFGAYALVIPHVISAFLSLLVHRWVVRQVPPSASPNPWVWWGFMLPALWLGVEALSGALLSHGSNFIIGVVHDSNITGLYFWGYAVSAQAVFMLARKLQGVFFPSLTKLNENPERQAQAYLHIVRTLMIIVAPVCALQILLAEPLISLIFPDRWRPAIPVVHWLSVGMVTQPLSVLMLAVLKARGKFKKLALFAIINAGLALTGTLIGALLGEQTSIAQWTGLALFAGGMIQGWATVSEYNMSLLKFVKSLLLILSAASLAGIIGLSAQGMSDGKIYNVAVIISLVVCSYSIMIFFAMREDVSIILKKSKTYLRQVI